jgi:hypothetical protein
MECKEGRWGVCVRTPGVGGLLLLPMTANVSPCLVPRLFPASPPCPWRLSKAWVFLHGCPSVEWGYLRCIFQAARGWQFLWLSTWTSARTSDAQGSISICAAPEQSLVELRCFTVTDQIASVNTREWHWAVCTEKNPFFPQQGPFGPLVSALPLSLGHVPVASTLHGKEAQKEARCLSVSLVAVTRVGWV